MALFTRADDVKIPLLTRLLQIEQAELDYFLWWAEGHEIAGAILPNISDIQNGFKENAFLSNGFDERISDVANVRKVSYEIMGGLSDNDNIGITWGAQTSFLSQIKDIKIGIRVEAEDGKTITPARIGTSTLLDQEAIIPRSWIKPAIGLTGFQGISQAWYDLYQLVTTASIVCRRCPICDFPFIVKRAEQIFCSNRCRTRDSVKKAYRKKHS